MIVQPDYYDVKRLIHSLGQKHSHIHGIPARLERAETILLDNGIWASGEGIAVASQTRTDGHAYTVAAGRCTCADFANGAPMIGRGKWCKHKLAASIYRRFVQEQIAERIIGDGRGSNHKRQKAYPNTYLLFINGALWSERVGVLCRVNWNSQINNHAPATDHDLIACAEWLEQANELPGRLRQETDMAREWQSQLTAEQFDRWMKTGLTV